MNKPAVSLSKHFFAAIRSICTPFLFVFLVFSFTAFAQDESEVISVDSSTVILNISVTGQDGSAVAGLKKEDFSVFESGKQQSISFFSAAETPFAAVILIDSSGSMENRMSMARSAAINFLDGLRSDDHAAIYRFASKVVLIQEFSNSRDVHPSLFDAKADGMTSMNDAIYKAAQELKDRPEKRKAIIVLSDGEDNFSKYSSDKALKSAIDAEASIYTVDMSDPNRGGSGRTQNPGVLRRLGERSGGKFLSTPGGAALRTALEEVVNELGQLYTIGYEPPDNVKDGKWRPIEVRIQKRGLTIRTRKGYSRSK